MTARRTLAAFALGAVAAIFLGISVGQGQLLGKSFLVGLGVGGVIGGFVAVTLVPLLLALSMLLVVRRERRGLRIALPLVAAFLFVSSCALADKDSGDAFNDCVKNGEVVRAQLQSFRSRTGRYPAELSELGRRDLPCSSRLRGSILQYERRGDGYYLAFEDFLVIHEATEKSEFFATHK